MKKYMKKFILLVITLMLLANANARMNNTYQYDNTVEGAYAFKIQPITNDAITLNTKFDDIDIKDPRIKSVIEYAKTHGNSVSVIFFAPDNLRYVKRVNKLFQDNHITTDRTQFATPQHLIDLDLISQT